MVDGHATVLSVDQLAKLVHKSPASVRSDASRNPSALPPICRLPGNKRLLWRLEDVQAWLEKYVDRSPGVSPYPVEVVDLTAARKRGRPRKTEPRSRA
jgi:hypothetical protein